MPAPRGTPCPNGVVAVPRGRIWSGTGDTRVPMRTPRQPPRAAHPQGLSLHRGEQLAPKGVLGVHQSHGMLCRHLAHHQQARFGEKAKVSLGFFLVFFFLFVLVSKGFEAMGCHPNSCSGEGLGSWGSKPVGVGTLQPKRSLAPGAPSLAVKWGKKRRKTGLAQAKPQYPSTWDEVEEISTGKCPILLHQHLVSPHSSAWGPATRAVTAPGLCTRVHPWDTTQGDADAAGETEAGARPAPSSLLPRRVQHRARSTQKTWGGGDAERHTARLETCKERMAKGEENAGEPFKADRESCAPSCEQIKGAGEFLMRRD